MNILQELRALSLLKRAGSLLSVFTLMSVMGAEQIALGQTKRKADADEANAKAFYDASRFSDTHPAYLVIHMSRGTASKNISMAKMRKEVEDVIAPLGVPFRIYESDSIRENNKYTVFADGELEDAYLSAKLGFGDKVKKLAAKLKDKYPEACAQNSRVSH